MYLLRERLTAKMKTGIWPLMLLLVQQLFGICSCEVTLVELPGTVINVDEGLTGTMLASSMFDDIGVAATTFPALLPAEFLSEELHDQFMAPSYRYSQQVLQSPKLYLEPESLLSSQLGLSGPTPTVTLMDYTQSFPVIELAPYHDPEPMMPLLDSIPMDVRVITRRSSDDTVLNYDELDTDDDLEITIELPTTAEIMIPDEYLLPQTVQTLQQKDQITPFEITQFAPQPEYSLSHQLMLPANRRGNYLPQPPPSSLNTKHPLFSTPNQFTDVEIPAQLNPPVLPTFAQQISYPSHATHIATSNSDGMNFPDFSWSGIPMKSTQSLQSVPHPYTSNTFPGYPSFTQTSLSPISGDYQLTPESYSSNYYPGYNFQRPLTFSAVKPNDPLFTETSQCTSNQVLSLQHQQVPYVVDSLVPNPSHTGHMPSSYSCGMNFPNLASEGNPIMSTSTESLQSVPHPYTSNTNPGYPSLDPTPFCTVSGCYQLTPQTSYSNYYPGDYFQRPVTFSSVKSIEPLSTAPSQFTSYNTPSLPYQQVPYTVDSLISNAPYATSFSKGKYFTPLETEGNTMAASSFKSQNFLTPSATSNINQGHSSTSLRTPSSISDNYQLLAPLSLHNYNPTKQSTFDKTSWSNFNHLQSEGNTPLLHAFSYCPCSSPMQFQQNQYPPSPEEPSVTFPQSPEFLFIGSPNGHSPTALGQYTHDFRPVTQQAPIYPRGSPLQHSPSDNSISKSHPIWEENPSAGNHLSEFPIVHRTHHSIDYPFSEPVAAATQGYPTGYLQQPHNTETHFPPQFLEALSPSGNSVPGYISTAVPYYYDYRNPSLPVTPSPYSYPGDHFLPPSFPETYTLSPSLEEHSLPIYASGNTAQNQFEYNVPLPFAKSPDLRDTEHYASPHSPTSTIDSPPPFESYQTAGNQPTGDTASGAFPYVTGTNTFLSPLGAHDSVGYPGNLIQQPPLPGGYVTQPHVFPKYQFPVFPAVPEQHGSGGNAQNPFPQSSLPGEYGMQPSQFSSPPNPLDSVGYPGNHFQQSSLPEEYPLQSPLFPKHHIPQFSSPTVASGSVDYSGNFFPQPPLQSENLMQSSLFPDYQSTEFTPLSIEKFADDHMPHNGYIPVPYVPPLLFAGKPWSLPLDLFGQSVPHNEQSFAIYPPLQDHSLGEMVMQSLPPTVRNFDQLPETSYFPTALTTPYDQVFPMVEDIPSYSDWLTVDPPAHTIEDSFLSPDTKILSDNDKYTLLPDPCTSDQTNVNTMSKGCNSLPPVILLLNCKDPTAVFRQLSHLPGHQYSSFLTEDGEQFLPLDPFSDMSPTSDVSQESMSET